MSANIQKKSLKQTRIDQKLIKKMKALSQLQEVIGSFQRIKGKLQLMWFPIVLSDRPQDNHRFRDHTLTEIESMIKDHIHECEAGFLANINQKIHEYELKSGEKLGLNRQMSLGQINNNVAVGENINHMKHEVSYQSEDNMLGPILLPNFRQKLNNSQEIGVKHNRFKSSECNRSYQQSHQSFYTALESENLQVKPNLETSSLREDPVKILNEDVLEKFQSIDGRSEVRPLENKVYREKQTVERVFKLEKVHETKIVIKKKNHKLRESKSHSGDVEQALLQIIYGKDLFPFIKFYLNEVKQNRIMSTPKSKKPSYSEHDASSEPSSQKIQQRGVLHTFKEDQQNPLVKYLTKGNTFEDLTIDEVMEAKFQRLVIICFDTVLHTLKTMSYFMPIGEMTEIIGEIERQELNVYRQRCLGSQEKDIENMCKKVKKTMKFYRGQMKDQEMKKHFFNKTLEIKTHVG